VNQSSVIVWFSNEEGDTVFTLSKSNQTLVDEGTCHVDDSKWKRNVVFRNLFSVIVTWRNAMGTVSFSFVGGVFFSSHSTVLVLLIQMPNSDCTIKDEFLDFSSLENLHNFRRIIYTPHKVQEILGHSASTIHPNRHRNSFHQKLDNEPQKRQRTESPRP